MNSYSYRPRGVCASQIRFDLEDGKLHNIAFTGGCNGNLKAIGKLLEGADADFAIRTLKATTAAAAELPAPTSSPRPSRRRCRRKHKSDLNENPTG